MHFHQMFFRNYFPPALKYKIEFDIVYQQHMARPMDAIAGRFTKTDIQILDTNFIFPEIANCQKWCMHKFQGQDIFGQQPLIFNIILRRILISGNNLLIIFFRSIGWRLGLQALTGVITTLFVLGTFYRSASLYHPQRRAILHLKSQKRKIKSKDKEKNKTTVNNHEDTPPFFDFTTLKSRTVQILLVSTSMAGLGLNAPLLYMVIRQGPKSSNNFLAHYCPINF